MHVLASVAEFGALLREARKGMGMTQQEFADCCGVGVTFISQLERGKESAEFGKALHVARRAGIDLVAMRRADT